MLATIAIWEKEVQKGVGHYGYGAPIAMFGEKQKRN